MSRTRTPLLTISEYHYSRLMASNSWRALEALLSWSNEVRYETVRDKHPCLIITFDRSEDFFRWRDWIVDTLMPFTYVRTVDDRVVVTVPVMPFFQSVTHSTKWRVSNRVK